jgi:ribosomal protein L7/L12
MNTGASPQLSAAAIAALHAGNKIEAIKLVREQRNMGLKEAKDAVEDYVRSQPSLQATLAAAQSETNRSVLMWLAGIAAVALLAFYFYPRF